MSSLTLPTHLQTSQLPNERQHLKRQDVGAGKTVTLDRVYMRRNGWRYEVNAEYFTRDADGNVHKRDTLWLPDHDQAARLFAAAARELLRGQFDGRGGLTAIARRLDLRFSLS
jgi:predicted HAD superfamily hydrolase